MINDGCIPPDINNAAVLSASGMMIFPYGDHSFAELKKHYQKQIENSDSDIFLFKDMSMLSDMRAALLACRKNGKKAFAVLNLDDELRTSSKLHADAALITLQNMGLDGFGIITDDDDITADALVRLSTFAKIPIFAKLNDPDVFGEEIKPWGEYFLCCVYEDSFENEITLANELEGYFLEPDTTEISDGIPCEANMDEILCDISQESYDVLKIEINTPDDAMAFIQDAHMATLPVMFSSGDDVSLLLALMLYQGRALIDSEFALDPETIEKAKEKYGAILY